MGKLSEVKIIALDVKKEDDHQIIIGQGKLLLSSI